jgi:hypothetical protein
MLTSRRRERPLDLTKIVSDLTEERDRLTRAITALLGSVLSAPSRGGRKRIGRPKGSTTKKKRRGGITPEGRRRLSIAMKKRWAAGKMKTKGK